ncbi:MAG: hypothetical protein COZ07_07750 [Candidatus Infernicultor aquiphilus]|uniref:Peptidase S55 domain-containing protein n=1 Tax=Candidatus Infernicultor aquiphilus TaxID=1805029 RepID=A0A2M7PN69_9BACT|nr:MAG: hypothetical protein COZ07_07750 [Candidatus Atribacteria bacterium CG_4_10_14_3_um_filter_34_13]
MKLKLNKNFFIKFVFILLIMFIIGINMTSSQSIFMPVSEIKPDMKGIGKTVFHGTKIDTFQVDIIDIVKGESGITNFILAYLSGDKIEESGGISEGMSGSPVYINGRLIGAISYAWEMSEHNLCLITPIQEMLRMLNLTYNYNQVTSPVYQIKNSLQDEITFYPIISPVIISGIKGRSLERLSNSIKKFNIIPIQGVMVNETDQVELQGVGERSSNEIEAGSAIGIQLTRGDVNIISIGTVTYREGNKILALGHPFLKKGEVSYLLSAVYIYHSLPNLIMPFKLGSPLNLVGKVVQDREAGILAILNSYPPVIPLKIQVTNIDSGLSYQMGIQMVNNYDLLEPLISNITVQAVDNALDRIGAGTAQVEIKIKGKEEGEELYRENMFYSSDDIATKVVTEIPEIIDIILNNYLKPVDLTAININIKIDSKKKIGKLEEVILEGSSFKPGDLIKARIKIRPFREELIEKMLTIQLSSHLSSGEATLIVRGGDLDNQPEEQLYNDSNKKAYKSIEEIFKDISDKPKGNQIMGEIIIYSDELPSEEKYNSNDLKKEKEKNLLISKIETDMVIEGYLEIPFTILEN